MHRPENIIQNYVGVHNFKELPSKCSGCNILTVFMLRINDQDVGGTQAFIFNSHLKGKKWVREVNFGQYTTPQAEGSPVFTSFRITQITKIFSLPCIFLINFLENHFQKHLDLLHTLFMSVYSLSHEQIKLLPVHSYTVWEAKTTTSIQLRVNSMRFKSWDQL